MSTRLPPTWEGTYDLTAKETTAAPTRAVIPSRSRLDLDGVLPVTGPLPQGTSPEG